MKAKLSSLFFARHFAAASPMALSSAWIEANGAFMRQLGFMHVNTVGMFRRIPAGTGFEASSEL